MLPGERDRQTGDGFRVDVGERERRAGFAGLIAPSAAVRDERAPVVFRVGLRRVTEVHSRIQVPPKSVGECLVERESQGGRGW